MVTIEIMNKGGEDQISNLPDDVVTHIMSRLPTKDAIRTSVLSKDWKHRWTSIYNIQLDDRNTSLRGKIKNKSFASFVERVLDATQDSSRIKSFRLRCLTKSEPGFLKTCVARVLKRGVEKLEIKTYACSDTSFVKELYYYKSLTELKLQSDCYLSTSRMKNCFPNLKMLHLGQWVCLSGDRSCKTSDVVLNFPVLEELKLRYCSWERVKYVEINAPALINFVVEGHVRVLSKYDYLIKIYGPKLQKFESCGYLLDNYHVVAPSISKAILTNIINPKVTVGFRAHALLKGFSSTLQYLKLSNAIVKALIKASIDFSLLRFNNLKQLELKDYKGDEKLLKKLLQVMPSLESFSLYMCKKSQDDHHSHIAEQQLKIDDSLQHHRCKRPHAEHHTQVNNSKTIQHPSVCKKPHDRQNSVED